VSARPAIEGGRPVRSTFLPFSRPAISSREIAAVTKTLRSGWITMGPKVHEFEEAFMKAVGARHAVAVSSCTAAMHTALAAAGVGAGDEVVTSPFTFTATANVVVLLGAKPVFADIEPDTFNLDPEEVEKRVTQKTKAIIPVDYGGHPCEMSAMRELAASKDAFLLEDAAHSFGATYGGKPVGSLADATAFSFYTTKNLTTGDGGMLTTDDGTLADRVRILRLHGISRDAWKRYTAAGDWYYEVEEAGFKYNMTDIAAAMGLVQLRRAAQLHRRRRTRAQYLAKGLRDLATVTLPVERKGVGHAWHLFPILLDPKRLRIDRGKFIEALRAENVGTSVHFIPLHLQPFYRRRFRYGRGDFPVAESVYERTVSLPFFATMTDAEADDVIDAVSKVVRYYEG